jgi:hypothetical protein
VLSQFVMTAQLPFTRRGILDVPSGANKAVLGDLLACISWGGIAGRTDR